MKIHRRYFPEIIPDNEEIYFAHFEGVVSSVDELANVEITRMTSSYNFRIAPSLPKYNDMLLKEILQFHNLFNIHLDISKSIKASGTLSFEIKL